VADGLVAGHLSVWLDAMLQAEELPAPGFRSAMHIRGMGASWEVHGKFPRNFTGNSRNSWDFYGMFNGCVWILMGC